jgi:hypothetical protein
MLRRCCCCFVTRRDVVDAINTGDASGLRGKKASFVHIFATEPLAHRGVYDADGTSLLDLAAEKSPVTFDILWNNLYTEQKQMHANSLEPLLIFCATGDEDRFFEVWHHIDVQYTTKHEKLLILKTARRALKRSTKTVKLGTDDYDANDRILRAAWFRLNQGLSAKDWIGDCEDATYLRWLLEVD